MFNVDIGIFAHDEEDNIKHIIEAIQKQDIFSSEEYSVKVYVLANGCQDKTVSIAKSIINEIDQFEVIDLQLGGKSRTWNRFVHKFSRNNADQLIFCDSDIWFSKNSIFRSLSEQLTNNPMLAAVSSRPVKDLTINKDNITFSEKVIAASGNGLNNWKESICGQLYILNAEVAKSIYLPIGLPVEDGYVKAMIATDNMTESENLSKISGTEEIFHFYCSERTIRALINHQTRIVIGGAINSVIFSELREKKLCRHDLIKLTELISENESWLPTLIQSKLPSKRYGWVPWHFLIKRFLYAYSNPRKLLRIRPLVILILGLGFDFIVFIKAQYKMARGNGAGYW